MAEVRLDVDLAHPTVRVWRALSDARVLAEWFMPGDLVARPGAEFTLHPGTLPGFLAPIQGEVLEVATPTRLVMRWQSEKLFTRVSWELIPTAEGCRLELRQTGFVGAPAQLRLGLLRATFTELCGVRLPLALDRLAIAEAGLPAGPARPPLPPLPWFPRSRSSPAPARTAAHDPPVGSAGTPRPATPYEQQRMWGNAAVAVWSATRRPLRPAAGPPPARVLPTEPPARGWGRSLLVATAAASFAVVMLAVIGHVPDQSIAEPLPGQAGPLRGPGMVAQPTLGEPAEPAGAGPSRLPASPGPGGPPPAEWEQPGVAPGEPVDPASPVPVPAPAPPEGPAESSAAPPSPAPSSPAPGPEPELAAVMRSSGLPLLGGRLVQVTVSNHGSAPAPEWEVTMGVGKQEIAKVEGAGYTRDGGQLTFVGGQVGPGESVRFQFEVRAPVLDLLGASDPTGCQIAGYPCD